MKIACYAFALFVLAVLTACSDNEEANSTTEIEVSSRDTSQKLKKNITKNADSVIGILQGQWKESEYPFRVAHFKESAVRFIEEGVVEEPKFRDYTISQSCPFQVNNIKNARPDDIFLVMEDAGTCEILKVAGDSLTLSGFNVSSNSNYNIVYKRVSGE